MNRRLLVYSVLSCALLLALGAGISRACDHASTASHHASTACCARTVTAFVPLPAPAPTLPAPFAWLPSAAPQPLVSGLRAFIDPETGQITSNTGLLQAPVDLGVVEPDYATLPQIAMPDGSFMIDTRGIMLDNLVVHVDALGHRSFTCTRDARAIVAPVIAPNPTYTER